ncbi:MAG: phytanoyl-CoA dioxygenase family protein [Gammaproteobacteria bacterium]|nr:phytanoyl-CoA dioxygenase family protein [Gammaproteobacteria bacterium]
MSATNLSANQIDFFNKNGYLVVANAIDSALLVRLQQQFCAWVAESRDYRAPWGQTVNGKPRFDLDDKHSAARPGLRRVNAPIEISQDYYAAVKDSRVADFVAALIGPDIKLHHSKINSKLPGSGTEVKWHQDFSFTPHTNDDLVTALVMIDEVTESNGPLRVVPGSHRRQIHSLWQNGVFTGAVDTAIGNQCEQSAVDCTGSAGSVCLMHTRLLHGSRANVTRDPRTLFIVVYAADDAYPCSPNPMPHQYEGEMIRGKHGGNVRCMDYSMTLPELPGHASFFDQQAGIG